MLFRLDKIHRRRTLGGADFCTRPAL